MARPVARSRSMSGHSTVPDAMRNDPSRTSVSEVLPDPTGPTMAHASPSRMVHESSSNTVSPVGRTTVARSRRNRVSAFAWGACDMVHGVFYDAPYISHGGVL